MPWARTSSCTSKPDTDDEKYSEFLESWRLQELVRKYSDYIRFPIRMEVSKTRRKEGSPDDKPEYETYQEEETLNSMVPIWQRRKSSVKPEEYNKFYRDKFHDYADPKRSSPCPPRAPSPTRRCCSSPAPPLRLLHQGV